MPLSEMCPMTKGKLDPAQDKNTSCSKDSTFVQETDFVELIWENGPIMMQGQSSRARKSPTSTASMSSQSHEAKFRVKDIGNCSNLKLGKFGTMDSVLNEYPFPVPIGEMGLNQDDDDTVPWLSYPVSGSLQHEYGSDILPELSGVTVNELTQNNFPFVGKAGTSSQNYKDSQSNSLHNHVHLEQGNASKVSSAIDTTRPCMESGSSYPFSSPQCQISIHSSTSRVLSNIGNSTSSPTNLLVCKESSGIPADGFCEMKLQNSNHPSTSRDNSSLMNFSHFTRPVVLYRAKSQNRIAEAGSGLSDKGSLMNNSAPTDSMLVNSATGSRKETGLHYQHISSQTQAASKLVETKRPEESPVSKPSEAVYKETALVNHKTSDEFPGESTSRRLQDGEKAVEPVVAASSVCSGNSVDRASNDPKLNSKRKWHDTDESGCPSVDIEAESAGVKKAASNRSSAGSKRSRAAEVHNLSERRRRDRINEKMRALQELIPNCNKVDKASMLDEAIEYLKTLQLQVQIMSMGAGMYISPLMLPTGMQHLHPSHMAQFSPMGNGMGMGFGMGMLDMNGGPSACSMIQMPSMQGTHFPSSQMFGPAPLHRLPRSNPQIFGHPYQGLAMSMSQASTLPFPGGPVARPSMGVDTTAVAGQVGNSDPASTSGSKDLLQNANSQAMQSTDASSSGNLTCTQCQTSMPLGETALVQNNQVLDSNPSKSFPSANANDNVTE